MMLTIEEVSKKYKNVCALNDVSLQFTNGVYGILGANGSGKTTLMKIITTILTPSDGKVLYDGTNIIELGDKYRDLLGYLPQHVGLYKNFSAEKFLYYMAALKGIVGNLAKKRVSEVLDLVGLTEKSKEKIGTFSGGMKQRVGIAQALLNDPKILIVDEPTAGLDPKERIRFRNLLSTISLDRIVILSTHIVSDIEFISKEIIVMKKGSIMHQAQPEVLLQELHEKVWSVSIEADELLEYQKQYKVANIIKRGAAIELRIISEQRPGEAAIALQPNLEDLYLYYF